MAAGEGASALRAQAMLLMRQIGVALAKLHASSLVHGDLTTSNMMLRQGSGTLVFIDFGLASSRPEDEDKAVDLYVMERAFLSTHPGAEALVEEVLRAYEAAASEKGWKGVNKKLQDVRMRGRKRSMFG